MTDGSDPPTTIKRKAPHSKIHPSTWVIATLFAAMLLIANVPGQLVFELVDVDAKYGIDFNVYPTSCEHGWPLTYLWRDPYAVAVSQMWSEPSVWDLNHGVIRFDAARLLLNALVSIVLITTASYLFEFWRRSRGRLFQIRLNELIAVLTMVSVLLAWAGTYLAEYRREQHALSQINEVRAKENTAGDGFQTLIERDELELMDGGPTWLRQLVGDHWFSWMDRVTAIDLDGNELSYATELRHLQVVRIYGAVTPEELALLNDLPELKALDLMLAGFRSSVEDESIDEYTGEEHLAIVGQLSNLTGINLYGNNVTNEGLAYLCRLSKLEVLELSGTQIDDRGLPHLVNLSHLRKICLADTAVTDSGLEVLGKLHELRDLQLRSTGVTGRGLQQLQPLQKLKTLSIPDAVPVEARRQLESLLPGLNIY